MGGGGQGGSCFAASVYSTLRLADRCKAQCEVGLSVPPSTRYPHWQGVSETHQCSPC